MSDNVELQATCAALGYLDGDKYFKEPDCLETVKDLIRFLKRDDESCGIRCQLGEIEILQKDLIPIVKQYSDDTILLETVTRLMVNLTQPAKLCFQNHVPEDITSRHYYLEIESHLQSYKKAFSDENLFAVFTKKLGDLLKLDWEHRQEEDRLLIERILIVLRNILHVPPDIKNDMRPDNDMSDHDRILWALHTSGMEDLLLYLSCSEDERQFVFHTLEIVSLMFREQTAEHLATAGASRAETEKEQDKCELDKEFTKAQLQLKAKNFKYSSRQSMFGSTFVVANMKSISDNNMIYHSGLNLNEDIKFNQNKKARRRPRNRKPIIEEDVTRRSRLQMRIILNEFCRQFLENGYNTIMRTIKHSLMRSKSQENDETYYLWAIRFFMEFNRRFDFKVELVSETMSVSTFHYIQSQLQNYHEMILGNHKDGIIWSRRMHLALKAYHELLLNIVAMDNSSQSSIRESSKVIKGNVFYMMEYRDIFVLLLRKFDETRQSRAFLRDLIEATHIFLKMLEQYSKQHSHLVVQKKKRQGGGQRRKKRTVQQVERTREELENIWDEVSGGLSAVLQGREEIPENVIPFDAASEVDMDQQRVDAVFRIQDNLRNKKPADSVALLRSAREVWPGRQEFGLSGISPEEEFMALREIFFTEFPSHARTVTTSIEEDMEASDDGIHEEEREIQFSTVDQEFNFQEFVLRFACPQVVRCYTILLADFQKHSQATNHCIVKMLHRLAYECHLIGMLFQAKLFRVFTSIINEPTSFYKELQTFARHILCKFFEITKTNDKVFVELFFWKTNKEALEITEGYGTVQRQGTTKQTWKEEEDEELRQLYRQFKENSDGKDVIDEVMSHMIDQKKTRRQVIRQLVHLDLINSAKDLKVSRGRTNPVVPRTWREEEELELRQLFEQYKNADDVLGEIISHLTLTRSRPKVIAKILELGLVIDKKELRKKRRTGAKSRQKKSKKWNDDVNSDEASQNESSDMGSDADDGNRDDQEFCDSTKEFSGDCDGMQHSPTIGRNQRNSSPPSSDGSENEMGDAIEPVYILKIRRELKKVLDSGLEAAVNWLKNCLRRTADDRDEDDDYQAVPIVPVTDEQEEAMETAHFHQLLKRCGLKPPANEQERFWRIPANLTPADLRSRSDALDKQALLNQVPLANKRQEAFQELLKRRKNIPLADNKPLNEREDDSTLDRNNQEQESQRFSDDRRQGNMEVEQYPVEQKRYRPFKRALSSDSESNNSSDEQRLVIDEEERARSRQTSKKLRQMDSDNNDDCGHKEVNAEYKAKSGLLPTVTDGPADMNSERPMDDLHTFPATMLSQPMSDSDLDDHLPLTNLKKSKRKAAIESDSE